MAYQIEAMTADDWTQVCDIYRQGIDTGHATFESRVPEWAAWNAARLPHPRLVARQDNVVIGWAMLSPVSSRAVYAGVAEVSLYVGLTHHGMGVGSALLAELITQSEATGIWTLQGSIFPENTASLALFAKHGFRQMGRRERIALMTYGPLVGTWRDTILVERRSQVAGR